MTHEPVSTEQLQQFSPLDGLKRDNLAALARKVQVRELSPGQALFKEGDTEKRTIYVVSGVLELLDQGKTVETITGGSDSARNPVSPIFPRRVSAKARDRVQFISIDSDLLDVMLTWDQTGTYEVSELQGESDSGTEDWMTMLLQTKAFHKIPPANIQAIFMRMQQINYKAGDVILKQGAEGDYFYVLTRGSALVTRETPLSKDGIKLAELRVGDTFGEEALISDAKRNATVTMLTDGGVMRLGKEDFKKLLNEPMLDWLDFAEAQQIIQGGGQWLDVRLPSEFDNQHLDGAINIPLYFIRLKLNTLDQSKRYVVCCDTGRRSSAGAYILSERGFQAYVLRGGINTAADPWLHRVRRLVAPEGAGKVVFDLLLGVALVLVAELHPDARRALALCAFRCHPDHGAGHRDLLVLAHQVEQHEYLVAQAVRAVGGYEQTAVDDERHVREVQGALVLDR
jgi:CRP-like cAMP-binding protein